MPLKYLFIAEFVDGSIIEQDASDKSLIDPAKRSRFFDVMQAIESGTQLRRFTLVEQGPEANRYAVDLRDGSFAVNGKTFRMHEGDLTQAGLRIIFWRAHTHTYHQLSGNELGHDIVYRMGWQYTMNGTNYQEVMEID